MASDSTADSPGEASKRTPSTVGMTTKVVKGSMWTLAGQVAPLLVSLVTTPFVIRILGAEGYGVLILVGLIPTYFAFADFGMSLASTKFASEAYAEGDLEKEARIVRTAALIALACSLPIAIILAVFSVRIIDFFNVPAPLAAEASLALKVGAAIFVINLLNGILNTPQLARLRMDLNTLVTASPRILGLAATPIVIYLGGGILGAVIVLLVTSLLTLSGHIFVSRRLLPSLVDVTIERDSIRLLLRFGIGLAISAVAGVLLANLEKVTLARTASVQVLAYYSVAFTFAAMTTLLAMAMTQSLIPAFSQLLGKQDNEAVDRLFQRSLRLILICALPGLLIFATIAQPFFTLWAGEEFGKESTIPFFFLLAGIFFNLLAHVPYSLLIAMGRTDLFARLHWIELFPYIFLIGFLTWRFAAVGAAAAWSLRIAIDAFFTFYLSRRTGSIRARLISFNWLALASLIVPMLLSIGAIWTVGGDTSLRVLIVFLTMPVYIALAWKFFLDQVEKDLVFIHLQKYCPIAK